MATGDRDDNVIGLNCCYDTDIDIDDRKTRRMNDSNGIHNLSQNENDNGFADIIDIYTFFLVIQIILTHYYMMRQQLQMCDEKSFDILESI